MDALLVSAVIVLAAAAVGLGAWIFVLRDRLRQLETELTEARDRVGRTERLGGLGDMTASFAHSFNEVLMRIVGRTQLMTRRATDPQLRESLDIIERAVLDGAQMVRRLQELVRRRRAEVARAVDLGVVVQEAVEATTAQHQRPVNIKIDEGTVPAVTGDPLSLREAVSQLLVNAVEAAPDRSTVTVSIRQEGDDAVVAVADTGIGMTSDVQARIFEPFFTTKPGAPGLGLGLVQSIIARHGGQIDVESTPGRGTTARLKLPVEVAARTRAAAPVQRPADPRRPARCLVVDDDPQVRDMVRDALSNAGHQVVQAIDGADGVEKFKSDGGFDVVVTDLAMPKLNGLQLARMCKTLKPGIPIVMLTGWGVLLTEEELAEHGVDEVLSKPVRMDQVLKAVSDVRARPAPAS